jgi:hypothetical protein
MQNDDFAIERREVLDERVQSLQDLSGVNLCGDIRSCWRELGVVQCRELSRSAASTAQDMRGRDMMGHAIDPGPQAAPSIEAPQTTPQREMDFLQKILLQRGISLVCAHLRVGNRRQRRGLQPVK